MQQLYDAVVAGKLSNEALTSASNCWIDVRDVAVAHVLATEKEAAGGERMIIAGGCYWWQDFGAFICFYAFSLHTFVLFASFVFAYIFFLVGLSSFISFRHDRAES